MEVAMSTDCGGSALLCKHTITNIQHKENVFHFIELALRYPSKGAEKNTALAFAMMDRGNIQKWFSSAGRIKCNQKGGNKSERKTGKHRMPLLLLFCT